MSVLELGCGNGLFLRFLEHLGVKDYLGIDGDHRVLAEMPDWLTGHVVISDFETFLDREEKRLFDRVVLFDVLEHFSPIEAAALLSRIAAVLAPRGRIIIRVPNVASPFGLGMQFNCLTHKTPFTPGSLRQLASTARIAVDGFYPQAYGNWWREVRERMLTSVLSAFLPSPPMFWSPNFIAVLRVPEPAAKTD